MLTNENTLTTQTLSPEKIYLEQFIREYCDRTKTSKQLTQAFRPTLADPRVSAGFSLPLKEMCYPIVAKKSSGVN